MATAECHFIGGLNSSSGGELKFYLKWKRNTMRIYYSIAIAIPIYSYRKKSQSQSRNKAQMWMDP